MAKITDLTLKHLCEVLKDLRGGSIGFDPFRDQRTNTKAKLLGFILKEHTNDAIIAAVSRVTAVHDEAAAAEPTVNTDESTFLTYVVYKPMGDGKRVRLFASENPVENADSVSRWIGENPQHQYLGRFVGREWIAIAPKEFHTLLVEKHDGAFVGLPKAAETKSVAVSKEFKPVETPEATQLAALLASMTSKAGVDAAKVREICDARAQEYVDNILDATNKRLAAYDAKIDGLQMPVTVHVLKTDTAPAVDLGHQHKNFPTLLKMAQAKTKDGNRLNIWLKGPAGSGKTTAAKKVSEALGMQFQFNGAISTEYELMGFKDAAGNYHRTAFREIFEHGGVYLFDEVDSSLPKAVLAFNAALANGECRFPDAMITRHPDCVVLAGANTAGNGANSDYVGRMKQDLAFLNRFVMLDWPLDEALEKALASNKDWVRKVQKMRANSHKRGIKGHIISPRATFYGEALLAVGLDEEIVEKAVLRGALTDDQWGQLCQ